MEALTRSMKELMMNAQTSSANHPRLTKNMLSLYLKNNFEDFLGSFKKVLKYCLIHGEKHPAVEKTLSFVAKFTTSVKSDKEKLPASENESLYEPTEEEVDPFLIAIFNYLLENHEANSRGVRYRVCYFINKLLNNMGEHASIDDELYRTIYDTMLERLMDKVPAIRVQAILAIARLQDPRNKDCPVIKAYRFHLAMDPNPDVRKAIINNIAITFQTLPDVLDRIRDVKDTVRRQTYVVLSRRVHIRSFTIAQRVLLISEGLNDRSSIVREAVRKNLLQAWIRLVDGKILDFLTCLDVEASTKSAELAMSSLFENVQYDTLMTSFNLLNDDKLIDINSLTPESSIYWKCLAKHFKKEGADHYLEQILPDLSQFCEYLEHFVSLDVPEEDDPQDTALKCMEKEFIMQQLISIGTLFDFSDEVGRQKLSQTIHKFFLNTRVGESCMKDLCELFELLHPSEKRITLVAEIISDLREPTTNMCVETPIQMPKQSKQDQMKQKIKIAKLRVQINEVREELEECVRSLNLEKAQELKDKLKELEQQQQELSDLVDRTPLSVHQVQNVAPEIHDDEPKESDDPAILAHCLLILSKVLSSPDICTLNGTLRSLHDNLVLSCLKSQDPDVRKYAVQALAMMCLISEELAQQHLLLFVQISKMDIEEIQVVALQAVFDFLHLYGIESFESNTDTEKEDEENKENVNSDMVVLLTELLNSDISEIRTLVAEGLCKLLLSSRIASSKLMSHLIVLWYNPTSVDDHMLRHMLGVFFPLYASRGSDQQEVISGAFIPTIRTIFEAPPRSPLSDIDIEDVASFLVSITSPNIVSSNSKQATNFHDSLVFNLCSEIIAFPDRVYTKVLLRSLNQLVLTPTNYTTLKQIDNICNKMLKRVKEKGLVSLVAKFQQTIQNYLKVIPIEQECGTPERKESSLVEQDTVVTKRKRVLYSTQMDSEPSELSDVDSDQVIDSTSILPKRVKSSISSNESTSSEECFIKNAIPKDNHSDKVSIADSNDCSISDFVTTKQTRSRQIKDDSPGKKNTRIASSSPGASPNAPDKKKLKNLGDSSPTLQIETAEPVKRRTRSSIKIETSENSVKELRKQAGIVVTPRIKLTKLSSPESSSQESEPKRRTSGRKTMKRK